MRLSTILKNLAGMNPSQKGVRRSNKWQTGSAEILEVRQLLTAQVTQMGDLNPVAETASSDPQELTQVGNVLYFTAMDKTHGRELWKKDGANAAVLVKDIFVGTESSSITEITAVGTTIFFAANNGINGNELWKSDGTAAGTILVKDHWASPGDSTTRNFSAGAAELTAANGKLFYRANPIVGEPSPSLMVSDGTAAGTGPVRTDMVLPLPWNFPSQITTVGNEVYFFGDGPGQHGYELWKSDGTSAGTVEIADVWQGVGNSFISDITPVGSTTFFTAWYSNGVNISHNRELWKTDGTAAGTVLVKDINTSTVDAESAPGNLINVNGTLYFSAEDGVNGRELWKSNGTAAGTVLVKDILTGAGASSPGNLTPVGSTLYFSASDGVTGDELWKTNGTAAGTVRVGHSGTSANFTPRNLTNIGGSLYFSAFTFETGFEIWKSDGTTAGTNVFKDLVAGASGSGPTQFTNVNGVLYYTASDGVKGNELWRHDVITNTAVVNDIFRGTLNSSPRSFVQAGSNVFFIADNGVTYDELWKCNTNGTGAALVKDLFPGDDSRIADMTNVNGTLYFSARPGYSSRLLWKSDGTAAGTVVVKENGPTDPSDFFNLNGVLYFTAHDGVNGRELWKSDGTTAGTVIVKNIAAGGTSAFGDAGNAFHVAGSIAYLTANDGINGAELWKTDGTAAGTVMVKDIWTATNGSSPVQMMDVNGLLYFAADDGINGRELWQSDGTPTGTSMVVALTEGLSVTTAFRSLTNAGGKLYFEYGLQAGGNPTGWTLACRPAATSALTIVGQYRHEGTPLTAVGTNVFFSAPDDNGEELWKSDGTVAGTVMVKDIAAQPRSNQNGQVWGSNPQNLVNNNGTLFFAANDMVNGQEIWMSDGTTDGTTLFANLTGDAGSSYPENLTVINNRIFGTAMSETTGREAFSVIDIVVPSVPSITAPAATTKQQRPTITWTTSTNAVSYDVFIKNNATGANPQVSVNVMGATSYLPTADLGIGKFSVWVRAVSAAGTKSAWSVVRAFTVNTSAVPAPMIRNQFTSRPSIVWKDLPGAVKFDVWLDSTTPGQVSTVILHNVTGKSWQNATDLPLGQYRAWVRGLDASGLAAGWSSVINFSVVTPPTMTGPLTSTFSQRPQFSWQSVASATKYEVQVKNLDTETLVVNQTNIATTNWTPPTNLPAGNYRWWSIAANANYRGQWSNPVDFNVGGRSELLTPTGSGSDTTPTFTWKSVTGAASYQLWVDRADTYVSAIINVSGITTTTYTPTTALPAGTFRVWVRAVSASGEFGTWSENQTFSIVAVNPRSSKLQSLELFDETHRTLSLADVLLRQSREVISDSDAGTDSDMPQSSEYFDEYKATAIERKTVSFLPQSFAPAVKAEQSDDPGISDGLLKSHRVESFDMIMMESEFPIWTV